MTKTLAGLLFAAACTSACSAKIHNEDRPDAGAGVGARPGSDVSRCFEVDCPFGCSESDGHCLVPVPSNDLAVAFQVVPPTQDIALGTGILDIDTAVFTPSVGGSAVTLPSIEVNGAPGGAPIRAIVGRHIEIDGTVIVETDDLLGPALALLASEQLDVPGALFVFSGSVDLAGCSGAAGGAAGTWFDGGGGGGFATAGGVGGVVGIEPRLARADAESGAGSSVGADPALVPLRGGCIGGASGSGTAAGVAGGAVQLYSAVAITVGGTLDVDGEDAFPGTGGGAGGGILVEAPMVTFGDGAVLSARGGGGAAGDDLISGIPEFANPIAGGTCDTGVPCGSGGAGATSGSAAQPGGDVDASNLLFTATAVAGGGGGGLGYIRINTAPGQLAGSAAVVSGAYSTGALTLQ
jgi:hypothetical protein